MKLFSNLKKEALKHKDFSIVFCSFFIFYLLRLPSLIEPYWYGDEGIYGVIGRALRAGRLLYKGIYDNKPPFLYLLYALFSSDLFWVRFASLLFGAGAIIALYFLSKKIFIKKISIYTSVALFSVLFGLPLLEGNIANAENFMALPIILAFAVAFDSKKKPQVKNLVAAGLLLSVAFLFKIVAVFDFAALAVIVFIFSDSIKVKFHNKVPGFSFHLKKIISLIGNEILLGVSFAIPILLTVLYFVMHGALTDFYHATFSQNVGYVGYGNYFIIPQGVLYLKLLLLAVALILIFLFKEKIGIAGVVIYTWTAFCLFNAFFDSRNYTHYMLVLLPSFCLLVGYWFEYEKTQKIVNSILLTAVLIALVVHFDFYTRVIPYYQNYVSYMIGSKTEEQYLGFFDPNTPRDYALAQFIDTNTVNSDYVFLWSDSGQIYVLSDKLPPGKYITAYHITDYDTGFKTILADLARTKPKYIIDTKHDGNVERFTTGYQLVYEIGTADIYERQF